MARPGRVVAALATVVVALALGGCGGSDPEPTGTPSSGPVRIEVTVSGETVTPNGDRVKVPAGEPVELLVTADAPGEIHVHSNPEQEFEYGEGSTTLTVENLDQPGVVEVESHTLDKVIVQLEVK